MPTLLLHHSQQFLQQTLFRNETLRSLKKRSKAQGSHLDGLKMFWDKSAKKDKQKFSLKMQAVENQKRLEESCKITSELILPKSKISRK